MKVTRTTLAAILVFSGMTMARADDEQASQAADTVPVAEELETVAYLGVSATPVSEATATQLGLPNGIGLDVAYVDPASPAAGVLQLHDVLHKLDDQILVSHHQLAVLLRCRAPGDELALTVIRAARPVVLKVTLAEKMLPKLRPAGGLFGDTPMRILRSPRLMSGQNPTNWPKAFQDFQQRFGFTDDSASGAGRAGATPGAVLMHNSRHVGGPGSGSVGSRTTSSFTSSGGMGVVNMSWSNGDDQLTIDTDAAGKRTLTARNTRSGETFAGPIDTEDQRKAVPTKFQEALGELDEMMEVQINITTPIVASPETAR